MFDLNLKKFLFEFFLIGEFVGFGVKLLEETKIEIDDVSSGNM